MAIDETKIKIANKWMYLRAPMDVDTTEILSVYLSSSRSSLDTYRFLKMVIKYCINKPVVVVDRGL
jgi:transposase-like protein